MELYREFEAASRREEDAFNRDVLLAFRIEAFRREKQVDVRRHLIGDLGRQARRPQSAADARTALAQLSAQYGIPVRTRKRTSRRSPPDGQ